MMALGTSVGRKLFLLFALYFCQGLPGGFLAVVLPVLLREQGVDLKTIGLAGALSLPWVLKVFWAPLVDAWGSARIGRRRSWLLPSQAGMLAVTLAFTTFRPEESLWTVAVLFLILNTFAATQDVAVDGWAVDLLEERELGPGNSAQIAGFKIGNLFGGGVLLALSGFLGWRGDFAVMAALIAGAMVLAIATPEPATDATTVSLGVKEAAAALWRSVARQGFGLWIFFVYAKFGESFGGAMIKPMLVDAGFSRAQIGVIDGIFGSVATVAGALVAGLWIRHRSWGTALASFSGLQGLALLGIGVYQLGRIDLVSFALINGVENFAGGGVGVCIFALAMRRSDKTVGASNFTAAQVTYMLGAFAAGPLSGAAAEAGGYVVSLVAGGAMALVLACIAVPVARRFSRSATLPG